MKPLKYRISLFQGILMLFVSVIFDLVELILALLAVGLLINRAVVILKWLIFFAWFKLNGVNLLPFGSAKRVRKRLVVNIITFVAGIIPFLGALPEFTVGIGVSIHLTRKEDMDAWLEKQKRLAQAEIANQMNAQT